MNSIIRKVTGIFAPVFWSALLCSITATWSSVAFGQTNLGAPTISQYCVGAGGGSGTCSYSGAGGADNFTATATYAGGEGYLSLSDNKTSYGLSTATPRIESMFEVLGPVGSQANLTLTMSGSTSLSGGGSVDANVDLVVGGVQVFQANACSTSGYECMQSATGSSSNAPSLSPTSYAFTVPTNTPENLDYSMYFYLVNQGLASATIDPNVTFTPGFDSAGYSLIYSSDASPVPLPATVWLMLGGLGGLRVLTRRHKQPA
jgi:hypothetical protein